MFPSPIHILIPCTYPFHADIWCGRSYPHYYEILGLIPAMKLSWGYLQFAIFRRSSSSMVRMSVWPGGGIGKSNLLGRDKGIKIPVPCPIYWTSEGSSLPVPVGEERLAIWRINCFCTNYQLVSHPGCR